MFELDRTKKFSVCLFVIAAVSAVLSIIGFFRGGGELLLRGYVNEPGAAAMMSVCFVVFLTTLLGGIGLQKVSRDVSELLCYINDREENKKK